MIGIYNHIPETNHVSSVGYILMLQPVCLYSFGTYMLYCFSS